MSPPVPDGRAPVSGKEGPRLGVLTVSPGVRRRPDGSSGSTSRRNPRAPRKSPERARGARRRPARSCGGRACAAWGCSRAATRPRAPGTPWRSRSAASWVHGSAVRARRGTVKRRRTTTGEVVRRHVESELRRGRLSSLRLRFLHAPHSKSNSGVRYAPSDFSRVWTTLDRAALPGPGRSRRGRPGPVAAPAFASITATYGSRNERGDEHPHEPVADADAPPARSRPCGSPIEMR